MTGMVHNGGGIMNEMDVRNEDRRSLLPACSIHGDETSVVLRVEMPGTRKDDIEVRIDGDQLVITGKAQVRPEKGTWLVRERHTGDYERRFTIDGTIDRERIDAVHELGVMTLTLHVREEVKPRRIEIKGK